MKYKEIASAAMGATFFAIPYLALSATLLPSLAIGVAAFGATELVLSGSKKINDLKESDRPLYERLENAKKQNKQILDMIVNVEDETVQKDLNDINSITDKIIATVVKNPKKGKQVNNFFDYYLPVVVKIVTRYDEIENQKLVSKDGKKFIEKAGKMIGEAKNAFQNILASLYESDIVDADAEMKVFNSMIKADGIGDEDFLKDDKEES